jgi:hypothetical protein
MAEQQESSSFDKDIVENIDNPRNIDRARLPSQSSHLVYTLLLLALHENRCRRVYEDCELCENEKGKQRLAHGLFSSDTADKPRSRYAMDFQGQGLAMTGETEALALIDSFTKTVLLIPLPDRQASTIVPRLLDELHFRRGCPDILHSDDEPEFLSELMAAITSITGIQRT